MVLPQQIFSRLLANQILTAWEKAPAPLAKFALGNILLFPPSSYFYSKMSGNWQLNPSVFLKLSFFFGGSLASAGDVQEYFRTKDQKINSQQDVLAFSVQLLKCLKTNFYGPELASNADDF